MNKQKISVLSALAIGILVGLASSFFSGLPFNFSPLGMGLGVNMMGHHGLSQQQALAIEEAKEEGVYNCCYEPGCSMCYMNGNEWNHGQAGTCDCVQLITQGKKPCPQCVEALSEHDEDACRVEECEG